MVAVGEKPRPGGDGLYGYYRSSTSHSGPSFPPYHIMHKIHALEPEVPSQADAA